MDGKSRRYSEMDQDAVIQACRQGEQLAQRALIQLYLGYVKSISFRYSSDDQDAEEIINDSFLKVFTHIKSYQAEQPFKGWLRTIVVNTAIDYYRKRIRRPINEKIEDAHIEDFDSNILESISAEEILAMVRKLSPVYRTVFSMFVIDGYSHKEIAERLGIKEGTSKSNLQDARRKLQQMIRQQTPELFHQYNPKTGEMANKTSVGKD